MSVSDARCTKCRSSIPPEQFNRPEMIPCSNCGSGLMVAAFPALLAGPRGQRGQPLIEDEASCFYHPAKKAVVPCESCGRFLCALCDVEVGSRHVCPGCLQAGLDDGQLAGLETRRIMYDHLALILAILPMVVTPLISLYLAVRHWSAPRGVIPSSRARWVLAVVIALAQVVFWAIVFLRVWRERYG